jgi:translation initiation factor 1
LNPPTKEYMFEDIETLDTPHLDIHVRVQQRNGRKCVTTIQGLPQKAGDLKALVREMKKALSTNGAIIDSEELGSIVQLQGDQRKTAQEFLVGRGISVEDIRVHGA